MKTTDLKQASSLLALAGVKHIMVAASSAKYADTGKQFAEHIIESLKAQQGESLNYSRAQAHVMKALRKMLPAFKGKKFSKLQVNKLNDELNHKTDVYDSCRISLDKTAHTTALNFLIYFTGGRSEFTVYLRTDEDGGFDPQATLKQSETHFDNVIKVADAAKPIDASKLEPLLIKFFDIGNEVADNCGETVQSFSGLLDYVSRH